MYKPFLFLLFLILGRQKHKRPVRLDGLSDISSEDFSDEEIEQTKRKRRRKSYSSSSSSESESISEEDEVRWYILLSSSAVNSLLCSLLLGRVHRLRKTVR